MQHLCTIACVLTCGCSDTLFLPPVGRFSWTFWRRFRPIPRVLTCHQASAPWNTPNPPWSRTNRGPEILLAATITRGTTGTDNRANAPLTTHGNGTGTNPPSPMVSLMAICTDRGTMGPHPIGVNSRPVELSRCPTETVM